MMLRNIPGVRRTGAAMLFAAALSAYGCIDRGNPYDPDLPLSFDPSLNLETFGAKAWMYPEGGTPSEGAVFLDDIRIVHNDGRWVPQEPVLWPAKDQSVCVLAYAPYGMASGISPDRGIEFNGIESGNVTEELLYGDPVRDLSKKGMGVIPVTFHEALCHVDFRMRTDAFPVEKVELKALRVLSLGTKGDFRSLPDPQWTLSATPIEVTLAEGSFLLKGEPIVICERYPLIPQRISTAFEADIDYTDTNGLTSHWTVATNPLEKNFVPGRSYTVDLSFTVETCTLTTL